MKNATDSAAADRTPRHSIGAVSRKTGLSIHVLRAWERRYGAVSPGRTQGRQRLYADADIARLRLLRRVTESGRPIGQVAHLSTAELVTLVGADGGGDATLDGEASEEDDRSVRVLARCLDAGEALDGDRLRAELSRAVVGLGTTEFVERIAAPLLVEAGDRWHSGAWRVSQEHVVSASVRRVVQWLLDTMGERGEAASLVVGTPGGERHELGAMLAGVVAAGEGWRVVYAGPDMPASDIALLARSRGVAAVALSLIHVEREAEAIAELTALRAALEPGVMMLVGGRAVEGSLAVRLREAGIAVVADMAGFRLALRTLAGRRANGAGAAA